MLTLQRNRSGTSSMKRLKTYADVAKTIDIEWCDGTGGNRGSKCRVPAAKHIRGYAEYSSGIVHWHERAVRVEGLRRFLMLVGALTYRHNKGQPDWVKLYEQNIFAHDSAMKAGRRIPARCSWTDRARVAYYLHKNGVSDVPVNVRAWASRRPR